MYLLQIHGRDFCTTDNVQLWVVFRENTLVHEQWEWDWIFFLCVWEEQMKWSLYRIQHFWTGSLIVVWKQFADVAVWFAATYALLLLFHFLTEAEEMSYAEFISNNFPRVETICCDVIWGKKIIFHWFKQFTFCDSLDNIRHNVYMYIIL